MKSKVARQLLIGTFLSRVRVCTRRLIMRKLFCIVAMIFAAVGVPSAHASGVDAIYAFGDSLSDTGNIYIGTGGALPLSPYVSGQFTNGNVWLRDFASDIGVGPVSPSLAGGTDYAYGGG